MSYHISPFCYELGEAARFPRSNFFSRLRNAVIQT